MSNLEFELRFTDRNGETFSFCRSEIDLNNSDDFDELDMMEETINSFMKCIGYPMQHERVCLESMTEAERELVSEYLYDIREAQECIK